ncbi:lipid droplet-associated protein [Pseudonocardia kujensis]|uniref:lipid droplet-associated protein n=1 Tax=Pseudonocardia kujensis TaxID=1128675 RepID=UPI001E2A3579|nr:lipid droplet-associated protein [Pseudonocardia kujensis]MCE0765269.1 lipid droplet-associated protein [Pseudonocardia kujensis]
MSPLPMPVRIAAGLAATAVEQVRELPRLVVEFPVTAVSQALQASMRVQQKVTELAIKGDKALGAFGQAPETPAWATFDDEGDEPTTNGYAAASPITPGTDLVPAPGAEVEPATGYAGGTASGAEDRVEGDHLAEPGDPAAGAAIERIAEQTLGDEADTPPAVLPEYPGMNLHQLRGKLRKLDLPGLQALLIWETSHENRPPFVTMLSNRITTVREG